MTTYSIDSLPIPYRSAGASPLGTHEGSVTPPEPPEPPTPTGLTYFSGKKTEAQEAYGVWVYMFDPSSGEHAEDFYGKKVGDEVKVTANGTIQNLAIANREEGEEGGEIYADFDIGVLNEDFPVLIVTPVKDTDNVWSFGSINYVSLAEIPGGVTLVIADPE
jgi:hypothetical protein